MAKKNNKYTHEEIKEIVNNLGYVLISENCSSIHKVMILKDKDGYFYSISLYNLNKINQPSRFGNNNPYTIQNIKLWLISNNIQLDLISKTYIDSTSKNKLIFKDAEGYLYTSAWGNLFIGYVPSKFEIRNSYTIQNIKLWLRLNKIEYELISEKYNGSDKKLILKDEVGYFYTPTWDNLKNRLYISNFNISNSYTIHNIKLWCKLNNKLFELISETYEGDGEKLQWKCLKKECGEIFEAPWSQIYQDKGCPYCTGVKVGLSNCLATKNPKVALEWHPTKNGDLTPFDVTLCSNKSVWWKCLDNPKHEWFVSINGRNNNGCPYCSGFYPSENYNLLVDNPKLCEEWNYEKNDKNPEEYTLYSNQYAWWKCKTCNHEWEAKISNRSIGDGCPKCALENHSGENHPNWKGGVTTEMQLIRNSSDNKSWIISILKRDNYTCQCCGVRGGKLNVHHKYNFADYPDLRFDMDNGVTLCENCHISKVDSFHHRYGTKNNTKEQFDEYISVVQKRKACS